ncbi:MAG TPA: type II secretion system F family protein [Bryobacteraceae bacterium]|nr:type II secretion system F family protein [Bryobacteraceae bacterium]
MIAIFLLAWLTTLATYALVNRRLAGGESAVAVRRVSGSAAGKQSSRRPPAPVLMRAAEESKGRLAVRLLERFRRMESTRRLLDSAGLSWSAPGLIHRSASLFVAGFLLVTVPAGNKAPGLALLAGGVAATLPLVYIKRTAARRIQRFEEQFPDCLEFLSRSMRAGHAFSVALEMVHREFSEPIAGEFRRVFEEQNFGQPLEIVLQKLGQRLPSMDVQFFISAVLLQKRTGGNLAELLDKLAQIMRERFKLRGRIRALSAQGLLSGRILGAIPGVVGGLMFLVNPIYARFFIDDPAGRQLLAGTVGLQIIGYLIIRKMVRIEV